jgi:hypothetical protein
MAASSTAIKSTPRAASSTGAAPLTGWRGRQETSYGRIPLSMATSPARSRSRAAKSEAQPAAAHTNHETEGRSENETWGAHQKIQRGRRTDSRSREQQPRDANQKKSQILGSDRLKDGRNHSHLLGSRRQLRTENRGCEQKVAMQISHTNREKKNQGATTKIKERVGNNTIVQHKNRSSIESKN